MNYSINTYEKLITELGFVDSNLLLPHEEVVEDRKSKLIEYLASLKPYLIIPSILVCNRTNMIIDGHHRYYALKQMNYNKIPVTYVNYQSKLICPHIDSDITKEDLLLAAKDKKPLKPKSSFHHFIDENYRLQPIILLSTLFRLDQI